MGYDHPTASTFHEFGISFLYTYSSDLFWEYPKRYFNPSPKKHVRIRLCVASAKITISMATFNSKLLNYERVPYILPYMHKYVKVYERSIDHVSLKPIGDLHCIHGIQS